ncbi:MAG: hypothetical protein ACYCT2_00035 [Thermoplasmataceae archaeon]
MNLFLGDLDSGKNPDDSGMKMSSYRISILSAETIAFSRRLRKN